MQNAIELRHITKTFGSVVANKDVFLTVRRGEILSLLGENGSGKTTLMNIAKSKGPRLASALPATRNTRKARIAGT